MTTHNRFARIDRATGYGYDLLLEVQSEDGSLTLGTAVDRVMSTRVSVSAANAADTLIFPDAAPQAIKNFARLVGLDSGTVQVQPGRCQLYGYESVRPDLAYQESLLAGLMKIMDAKVSPTEASQALPDPSITHLAGVNILETGGVVSALDLPRLQVLTLEEPESSYVPVRVSEETIMNLGQAKNVQEFSAAGHEIVKERAENSRFISDVLELTDDLQRGLKYFPSPRGGVAILAELGGPESNLPSELLPRARAAMPQVRATLSRSRARAPWTP